MHSAIENQKSKIENLLPGQRIRVTQTVRVGRRSWPAVAEGTVRDVRRLLTGLATERAQDDVVTVQTIHFVKDSGELSSIAIDENTKVEIV